MSEADDGGEFLRQAAICRAMGSPFTARVLEAASRVFARAPRTAAMITAWPGARGAAAVALRFSGGMHALALRRANPALAGLYADLDGDFDTVIGDALVAEDDFMARWMTGVPQTNEVYRAGAIVAGLAVASARLGGLPFELLELGSSAGLNLNLHRYAYDLGGVALGDRASALRIEPEWRGDPPPSAPVDILSACGVDIDPLDLSDPATRERLRAFVWPDQPARRERLEAAFAIAAAHPPRIDRADAVDWIAARLAEPQTDGVARAVFHSIVLQYLPREGREAVRAVIAAAGERATAERPLAWVIFEWDPARSNVLLRVQTWPGGEMTRLATCHAHCAWIAWGAG